MASKTTWFVQGFAPNRGQIKPTKRYIAPSASGAVKIAESWATREKGVAAIEVTADDDTGEVSDAKVLARHGEVPDDLADQIKGG